VLVVWSINWTFLTTSQTGIYSRPFRRYNMVCYFVIIILSYIWYRYVVKSKTSAKSRGIELLIRLMLEMRSHPPKRTPDFSILDPLGVQMVFLDLVNHFKNTSQKYSHQNSNFFQISNNLSVYKLQKNKNNHNNNNNNNNIR